MIPWFPPTRAAIIEMERTIAERRADLAKAKPGAVDRLRALEAALKALQFMDSLTVIEGMELYVESNGTPTSEVYARQLSSGNMEQSPTPLRSIQPPARKIPAF